MINRRTMITAALVAIPAMAAAAGPAGAAEEEIVIDESITDDPARLQEVVAWAKANGMDDPTQWGFPTIVRPAKREIEAKYYPGGLDSTYNYMRTLPLRVDLPASLR